MNYKKIIALTATVSMLTFAGCSSSKETESTDIPEPAAAAEMTAAATEATESETESAPETEAEPEETTTAAETEAKPASGLTAEEAYSAKNGASWTDALMKSATDWDKGNIVFKCTAREGEEITTAIEMSVYNNKLYMDTQIPGLMTMTLIVDGKQGYLIDKPSKTYAVDTETEYNADSEVESMVDTTADYSGFAEDGIENIDGTDYIYEKFTENEAEAVFYYDPDGKLCKMGAGGMVSDFTIDLLEEPDESCFEIPADYTEISMEEMSMKMMAGLLSAMEEASEGEDAE